MIKYSLIRAMTVAGFIAGMLISATANALYIEEDMAAIKSGFPLDMEKWAVAPENFSWNSANIRQGTHPDRPDGVVYIFKNKTDADAWWNPIANPTGMPTTIPDTAVAYMHWALDNDSGLFPGVMAITDDLDFQNSNCIMSSGFIIIDSETGVSAKKTCSNPAGSAKRFKLVILQEDEPIDLIFNMETKDLYYYNYDGSIAVPELTIVDDIFRNYRLLMKVGNGTGTDVVDSTTGQKVERVGTRLAGVKVELGFTDVTDNNLPFVATTTDEDVDKDGLLWEIRRCTDKRYWDIAPDHDIGLDECPAQVRETFLEEEFATFSPGMFAPLLDKRNENGGYWDKAPAGMVPPAVQKENEINSGTDTKNTPQVGAITSNYFDVAANQAAGSSIPIPDNMFGYMMYYGVFSDDDPGNIPLGIYIDEDGDPATEGSLYAWWDGSSTSCCYRWGIDRDHDGVVGPDAWGIVSDTDLAEMKARPLSETEVLDPPRYELGYMDDLGGLNMDTFIKLTPDYKVNIHPTFTVRITGQSIADAGVAASAPGVADGDWATTLPADASDFDPIAPDDPATTPTTSSDGGSSGFSLGWITLGLLALGLLLRRRRF